MSDYGPTHIKTNPASRSPEPQLERSTERLGAVMLEGKGAIRGAPNFWSSLKRVMSGSRKRVAKETINRSVMPKHVQKAMVKTFTKSGAKHGVCDT